MSLYCVLAIAITVVFTVEAIEDQAGFGVVQGLATGTGNVMTGLAKGVTVGAINANDIVSIVGNYNPVVWYSIKNFRELHTGCYKTCWIVYLFNEKTRSECISQKQQICKYLKRFSYKSFIVFHVTRIGGGKLASSVVQAPVNMVGAVAQVGGNAAETVGKASAVAAGITATAATEAGKVTVTAGKKAISVVGDGSKAVGEAGGAGFRVLETGTKVIGSEVAAGVTATAATEAGKVTVNAGKKAISVVGDGSKAVGEAGGAGFRVLETGTKVIGSEAAVAGEKTIVSVGAGAKVVGGSVVQAGSNVISAPVKLFDGIRKFT